MLKSESFLLRYALCPDIIQCDCNNYYSYGNNCY